MRVENNWLQLNTKSELISSKECVIEPAAQASRDARASLMSKPLSQIDKRMIGLRQSYKAKAGASVNFGGMFWPTCIAAYLCRVAQGVLHAHFMAQLKSTPPMEHQAATRL